jgi:hypothetical protein
MLNHYDLGLYVGWFEIPRDFVGLPELYGLKYDKLITSVIVFLYLCSYNLDGSVTAGIGARFNSKHVTCVFKTKLFFIKISFGNL